MFKKLFLLLTITASQVLAMEPVGEIKPGLEGDELKFRKNVKVVFATGQSRIWPAEFQQASQLEQHIAQKLVSAHEQAWGSFIAQGKSVLKGAVLEEQNRYFESVIKQAALPIDGMGYIVSKYRCEGLLVAMALFCKVKNKDKGTGGIWDKLLICKDSIDTQSFKGISLEDTRLINCLYLRKSWQGKECLQSNGCHHCNDVITVHVTKNIVSSCCADKVKLGIACDACAGKIKTDLSVQLMRLVCGFKYFGVPVEEVKYKQLIEWAEAGMKKRYILGSH